ncbi:hypothetical protein K435DRAFT_871801 [Dendrothele bispora CBS 962.96]|uniref:Uncharacterized protein n=1 Tax=Dendrothele bispora (strain CBS 962.96) TaxID=1314807 RepID=A0A4S8L394_DENBC|nr:hypothetical protein K435DRAFT_871801 [Dendrothele bispora CBS 962.96]
MKRELEDPDEKVGQDKRPCHRAAFSAATSHISEIIGPGGYLDPRTSETQYFGFLQSSGLAAYEDESQPQYGTGDDDLYYETQSQLPEEFSSEDEIPNSVPAADLNIKEEARSPKLKSPTPSKSPKLKPDNSWGPHSANGLKLADHLHSKYRNRSLLYEQVNKREDSEDVKRRWRVMRQDETDQHPSRLALLRLVREAGVTNFHDMNGLRQGHFAVASFLIRIANELIQHGGQAADTEMLRDTIEDGKILLDIATGLVEIEDKERAIVQGNED